MEMGKLTAKLRDAVLVCLLVEGAGICAIPIRSRHPNYETASHGAYHQAQRGGRAVPPLKFAGFSRHKNTHTSCKRRYAHCLSSNLFRCFP